MKTSKDSVMLAELGKALPMGFAKALSLSIRHAYTEAWSEVCEHAGLDSRQKEYLFPHYRRGIIESALASICKRFGVETSSVALSEAEGNCYTKLRVGRFVFSIHHDDRFLSLPRFAQFRRENSAVNYFLEQMLLFPDDPIDRESPIYGYVMHATDATNKHAPGEITIKIPSPDKYGRILCSYDISEVIEMQAARPAYHVKDLPIKLRRKRDAM